MSERISESAAYIAFAIAACRWDPRLARLVPPEAISFSERFVQAASPDGDRWLRRLRSPVARRILRVAETLFAPRLRTAYVIRKRFIESAVREAVAEGARQCVVLGAGFDSLAARLHTEFPSVHFVELDRPVILEVKRRALDSLNLALRNLQFIPADLEADWTITLDPNRRTVFVAEGLLMYLTLQAIDRVFERVAGFSRSRIVFTFIESAAKPSWRRRWIQKRESYRWFLARGELPEFLASIGFRLRRMATRGELLSEYLPGQRFPSSRRAELICVADRSA